MASPVTAQAGNKASIYLIQVLLQACSAAFGCKIITRHFAAVLRSVLQDEPPDEIVAAWRQVQQVLAFTLVVQSEKGTGSPPSKPTFLQF